VSSTTTPWTCSLVGVATQVLGRHRTRPSAHRSEALAVDDGTSSAVDLAEQAARRRPVGGGLRTALRRLEYMKCGGAAEALAAGRMAPFRLIPRRAWNSPSTSSDRDASSAVLTGIGSGRSAAGRRTDVTALVRLTHRLVRLQARGFPTQECRPYPDGVANLRGFCPPPLPPAPDYGHLRPYGGGVIPSPVGPQGPPGLGEWGLGGGGGETGSLRTSLRMEGTKPGDEGAACGPTELGAERWPPSPTDASLDATLHREHYPPAADQKHFGIDNQPTPRRPARPRRCTAAAGPRDISSAVCQRRIAGLRMT
jgi:hypothetical protein